MIGQQGGAAAAVIGQQGATALWGDERRRVDVRGGDGQLRCQLPIGRLKVEAVQLLDTHTHTVLAQLLATETITCARTHTRWGQRSRYQRVLGRLHQGCVQAVGGQVGGAQDRRGWGH